MHALSHWNTKDDIRQVTSVFWFRTNWSWMIRIWWPSMSPRGPLLSARSCWSLRYMNSKHDKCPKPPGHQHATTPTSCKYVLFWFMSLSITESTWNKNHLMQHGWWLECWTCQCGAHGLAMSDVFVGAPTPSPRWNRTDFVAFQQDLYSDLLNGLDKGCYCACATGIMAV